MAAGLAGVWPLKRRSCLLARHRVPFCFLLLLASPCEPVRAGTSFVRTLLEKPTATFADACRVVVILHTRRQKPASFAEDALLLREAGILPMGWRATPDKPIDRGEVSYLLCKTLGIKGGLIMRAFGVSRRYAFRECTHLRLLPQGHQHQYLTGEELVALVGLVEEYMRRR